MSTTTLTPVSTGHTGRMSSTPPAAIDVTVVIPMRNEVTNVAAVCSELQQVIDVQTLRYEVIIVNDGTADATAALTQRAATAGSHGPTAES